VASAYSPGGHAIVQYAFAVAVAFTKNVPARQ